MNNKFYFCTALFFAPLYLLLTILLSSTASASHFRVESDFDLYPSGVFMDDPIAGLTMMGSPFGGNYLIPHGSDNLYFGAIDVLPAGTTENPNDTGAGGDRYLLLSFDVINFDPNTEVFNIIYNQFGGASIQHQLLASDVTGGSNSNYLFELQFVLESTTQDFSIRLEKESLGEWGIDNFVVDWGTPVPIPSTAWLFGSTLFGLIAVSRGKRTLIVN